MCNGPTERDFSFIYSRGVNVKKYIITLQKSVTMLLFITRLDYYWAV